MRRGEIWLVALEPTVGAEIGKTRPVVIVTDETVGILLLEVIVPITDWKERYTERNWMVRLEPSGENGLAKVSAADAFVRPFRFPTKICPTTRNLVRDNYGRNCRSTDNCSGSGLNN